MKSILFVINNLGCGGAEKALISLLETIDYSKYKVDLFLFKHTGIFMSKIPKEVNLLSENPYHKYFDMPLKKSINELLLKGKFKIIKSRICFGYVFNKEKICSVKEQRGWKYLNTIFSNNDKEYDVAIGYLEKNPIYFCVDKINAKTKIGWIHNDYKKLKLDMEVDKRYFNKLDSIVTVSEECLDVLVSIFPEYKRKIKLMHNIISENTINRLADEDIEDKIINRKFINILSIGRLNYQKGFEMAIEACNILIKKGYAINWSIMGEGEERKNLEALINKYGIEHSLKLIGIKENPYPYMKLCDIYVQPSRFEGKSIAIDEAKILQKPIVVTNFSTVKDQIQDGENGLVSEMNGEDLANKIEKLICDSDLKNKIVNCLTLEKVSNEDEIEKLYELI